MNPGIKLIFKHMNYRMVHNFCSKPFITHHEKRNGINYSLRHLWHCNRNVYLFKKFVFCIYAIYLVEYLLKLPRKAREGNGEYSIILQV